MQHRISQLLIAAALAALCATGAQAKEAPELVWAGCGISKKAFMNDLAKAYEAKTGVKIDVQGGGATRGIRDTATGAVHFGGACRTTIAGNDAEKAVKEIPVAWDALVVIVNPNNPVDNISFDQLRDMYLGKIKNWKELGGKDAPIELFARRGKISGVGRTLRELVFADYDQEFAAGHVVKSSGPLEKGIAADPNGVGVTGISSAKRRKGVKILKLNGREPSYDNIKNGDYVLYRPLYLVIPRLHSKKQVDDFVKFALSKEGQEVIKGAGTVPYVEAMALVMKQLEQYRKAVKAGL